MSNSPILLDYIQYHTNVIPPEFCEEIIITVSEREQWADGTVDKNKLERKIRNVCTVNLIDWPELDHRLYEILHNLSEGYIHNFPDASVTSDEGYQVLRYEIGQFYKTHVDHHPGANRVLSCVVGLNDEYEGGEFCLWDGAVKYTLGKGDVLFFPSNFLYPHSVEKVTSGVRYTIVTWFR
jgi:predicted 2-oxoglutarate/Fe(II)-dependent dioxygenase YbiX